MRELLIGDLHFGIKSNSVIWLNKQCEFFRTQIFDIVKTKNLDRIVFLGDLTDARYSINQQVGIELKKVIRELSVLFESVNPDGKIIFVAGNHDFYTPTEDFANYNSYRLLFDEDFLKNHTNIIIVDQEPKMLDGALYLPWYWTDNTDHFDEILYRFDFKTDVQAIYCHADLSIWPGARITSLKNTPVYSGHIHNIYEDVIGNLYNLGAALPLTYADVNEKRYVYILEDFKVVEKIQNITTPQFIRLTNEEIFDIPENTLKPNNYILICISKSKMNNLEYLDKIKYIKENYVDNTIRIHVINNEEYTNNYTEHVDIFSTNISDYIKTNIPDHLKERYNYIKEKIDNQ